MRMRLTDRMRMDLAALLTNCAGAAQFSDCLILHMSQPIIVVSTQKSLAVAHSHFKYQLETFETVLLARVL